MQQLLNNDFKAIHCIGNGKVCTYFRGPEIIQMFGYDYGLLIFAAKMKKLSHIDELIGRMLALRDSTGAFVEYYADNKPVGTMCRPWESGINITSLLEKSKG